MVGMPKVWQSRFTGCWWLREYCAIHCSLVRLPNIGVHDTPAAGNFGDLPGNWERRGFPIQLWDLS